MPRFLACETAVLMVVFTEIMNTGRGRESGENTVFGFGCVKFKMPMRCQMKFPAISRAQKSPFQWKFLVLGIII